MLVTNCGNAFSFASALRQSYVVPQYCTSGLSFSSWTPWEKSSTVSRSGQRVAATRLRMSSIAVCGMCALNGRMERSSAARRPSGDVAATGKLSVAEVFTVAPYPRGDKKREPTANAATVAAKRLRGVVDAAAVPQVPRVHISRSMFRRGFAAITVISPPSGLVSTRQAAPSLRQTGALTVL
jgi:hypothetical protein